MARKKKQNPINKKPIQTGSKKPAPPVNNTPAHTSPPTQQANGANTPSDIIKFLTEELARLKESESTAKANPKNQLTLNLTEERLSVLQKEIKKGSPTIKGLGLFLSEMTDVLERAPISSAKEITADLEKVNNYIDVLTKAEKDFLNSKVLQESQKNYEDVRLELEQNSKKFQALIDSKLNAQNAYKDAQKDPSKKSEIDGLKKKLDLAEKELANAKDISNTRKLNGKLLEAQEKSLKVLEKSYFENRNTSSKLAELILVSGQTKDELTKRESEKSSYGKYAKNFLVNKFIAPTYLQKKKDFTEEGFTGLVYQLTRGFQKQKNNAESNFFEKFLGITTSSNKLKDELMLAQQTEYAKRISEINKIIEDLQNPRYKPDTRGFQPVEREQEETVFRKGESKKESKQTVAQPTVVPQKPVASPTPTTPPEEPAKKTRTRTPKFVLPTSFKIESGLVLIDSKNQDEIPVSVSLKNDANFFNFVEFGKSIKSLVENITFIKEYLENLPKIHSQPTNTQSSQPTTGIKTNLSIDKLNFKDDGAFKSIYKLVNNIATIAMKPIEMLFNVFGEGLSKIGKPDAIRGAITIGLLSGSLLLLGISLKTFNEVNWGSIVKGTLALLGLIGIGYLVGAMAPALAPAVPILIGFGAALLLMTGSFLILSIALPKFAEGLVLLGDAIIKFSENIASLSIKQVGSMILAFGALYALAAMSPLLLILGVSVSILGVGLNVLAFGLSALANIDNEKMTGAINNLFLLSGALLTFGKNINNIAIATLGMVGLGVGLLSLGSGLLIAGIGLKIFSVEKFQSLLETFTSISPKDILLLGISLTTLSVGFLSLGVSLGVFSIASMFAGTAIKNVNEPLSELIKTLDGASVGTVGSLIGLSAGLSILSVALLQLSGVGLIFGITGKPIIEFLKTFTDFSNSVGNGDGLTGIAKGITSIGVAIAKAGKDSLVERISSLFDSEKTLEVKTSLDVIAPSLESVTNSMEKLSGFLDITSQLNLETLGDSMASFFAIITPELIKFAEATSAINAPALDSLTQYTKGADSNTSTQLAQPQNTNVANQLAILQQQNQSATLERTLAEANLRGGNNTSTNVQQTNIVNKNSTPIFNVRPRTDNPSFWAANAGLAT